MCDEIGVFTDKEVKALDKKACKDLKAEAYRHFQARDIQKLVKKHPIAKVLHPHDDVRRKLRARLRPKLNELLKASKARKR